MLRHGGARYRTHPRGVGSSFWKVGQERPVHVRARDRAGRFLHAIAGSEFEFPNGLSWLEGASYT